MREAGFEYYVVLDDEGNDAEDSEIIVFTRDEYAQIGFGTYTGANDPEAAFDTPRAEVDDPNRDYVATLDAPSKSAYVLAFEGNGNDKAGCRAAAPALPIEDVANSDLVEQLRSELDDLAVAAVSSPLVSAERDDIYDCVAERGYRLDRSDNYPMAAAAQVAELWQEEFLPFEGGDVVEMDENGDAIDTPIELTSEQIDELTRREIDLATTVWDCGYPDFLSEFWTERTQLETEFIETRLPAYGPLFDG
jgi:hypothetical protein